VRQELLDVSGRKFRRMPIAVEPDEPADPIDVRLLGANAVVLEVARLVETDFRDW
jgi:hypothetical protein